MALPSISRALLYCGALVGIAAARPSPSRCHGGSNLKRFDLTLRWETGAPDGFERPMYKINGEFPGPLIELEEGDDVEVFVDNQGPYNTTVHFHGTWKTQKAQFFQTELTKDIAIGIEMLGTPWSDGMPGLSQDHIQPNCTFTYRWKATQHGSFWYHSHSSGLVSDGLFGPIIIHPKSETTTPYSLIASDPDELRRIALAERRRIPLLLSDWRHVTSEEEWAVSMQSRIENLCFDSVLINGKGRVHCLTPTQQTPLLTPAQAQFLGIVPESQLTDKSCVPPENLALLGPPDGPPADSAVIPASIFYGCQPTNTPLEVIRVRQDEDVAGVWVMLDLISAFNLHTVSVSLDEVPLIVVAADGNDIEPMAVDALKLTNGQRYTVMARLPEVRSYTLRVSSTSDPQILFGTSVIEVTGAADSAAPATDASPSSIPSIDERGNALRPDVIFFNASLARPYPPVDMPATADKTYKITMQNDASLNVWALNATTRPAGQDDMAPLLFHPSSEQNDNHTMTVAAGAWVDYVMMVVPGQPPHPVHFHGRHFYVLGEGTGEFPWETVDEAQGALPEGALNLVNPPARDTYPTPAAATEPSWLVVRRRSDNPGVWLVHCHIQSHLQGGMSMVLRDGIEELPPVPAEYKRA